MVFTVTQRKNNSRTKSVYFLQSRGDRSGITLNFKLCWFPNQARFWAEKRLTDINWDPYGPDESLMRIKNSVALKFWFWNLKLNLNLNLVKRRIQFWPGSALSPIVYIIQDKEWRLSCSAVWSYKGKEWNVTMRIKLYQNCIRSRPKKHYLEKSAFDNNTSCSILDCRLTEKNMWETRWHVTNLMHKDL